MTTLGSTQVITGITIQVGKPSPSQKSHGELDVALSFSPLCGGQYTTSGRIQSSEGDNDGTTLSSISYSDPQSLESWVKRTIIHSDLFDLSQLCVREGHSAWKVNVHCMVVNHDGNVIDACIMGIMMALRDLRLPLVSIVSQNNVDVVKLLPTISSKDNSANDVNIIERKGTSLQLQKVAIPLTIALFQGKLLVDPTLEEEKVADGMITVVVDLHSVSQDESSKELNGTILSFTKTGGGALITGEEAAACVQLALGRAKELKSILM